MPRAMKVGAAAAGPVSDCYLHPCARYRRSPVADHVRRFSGDDLVGYNVAFSFASTALLFSFLGDLTDTFDPQSLNVLAGSVVRRGIGLRLCWRCRSLF